MGGGGTADRNTLYFGTMLDIPLTLLLFVTLATVNSNSQDSLHITLRDVRGEYHHFNPCAIYLICVCLRQWGFVATSQRTSHTPYSDFSFSAIKRLCQRFCLKLKTSWISSERIALTTQRPPYRDTTPMCFPCGWQRICTRSNLYVILLIQGSRLAGRCPYGIFGN